MPKKKFSARLENLASISQFVVDAAQKAGLDDGRVYAVQLAVDEAATNIIEHAYRLSEDGDLVCECVTLPDGLKITLIDHGTPFDPDEVPEPTINAPLDQVRSRGLGLFFMRKMMDEVTFEFSAKRGNVLTMIKKRN